MPLSQFFRISQMTRKLHHYTGDEVRALRRAMGMNQATFWAAFQTVQSVGSRYETHRDIPITVQILLNIAFGTDKSAQALFDDLRELGRRARERGAKWPS